ncbi:MAG: hypothetical protein IT193_16940 [Propionibacteriaceae bacterium]|nr:hypothetical protein [Propionibacteriaceae bacterium]
MEALVPTLEALAESEPSNLRSGPVLGPDGVHGIAKAPYLPDTLKWLHIGTMYDHPKSWTFMGGGVAPGLGAVILYSVEIGGVMYFPDEFSPGRKQEISWSMRDGYQPCPVSVWLARSVEVTIQHFAVRTPADDATVVYSKVTLVNRADESVAASLHIKASPRLHLPLAAEPTRSDTSSMAYEVVLAAGGEVSFDFVSRANGADLAVDDPESYGTYEDNYRRMAQGWNERIERLAHPVRLPHPGIAAMYKAIQILLWCCLVRVGDDYEIRAGAPNPARLESYDRTFPHDVPNYVDQFIREGDHELGRKILESSYYRVLNSADIGDWGGLNYMDTIGKFLLPYAQYLQNTGDESYFDEELRAFLARAARNIEACLVHDDPEHAGLMRKGEDFENWSDDGDFLLCDNWAALHGLQAYRYLATRLGLTAEVAWVEAAIDSLNGALNAALDRTRDRREIDHYLGAFDDLTYLRYTRGSFYSWVPYAGALSTFPWGAWLRGYDRAGTWKEKFDASIAHALHERDRRVVPEGSWGAWWGHVTFGSTYNAAGGLQCLASDRFRLESLKNVEFLYDNQCAPWQWSEAFEAKGRDQWVGMYLPQESYGNYESWGTSFSKQAILQACASVHVDGTVILGRGVPDRWLRPGEVIEWRNINVNDGRLLNFTITSTGSEIVLDLSGDIPLGCVVLDLPALAGNVASADVGTVLESGAVRLEPGERSVRVTLARPIA